MAEKATRFLKPLPPGLPFPTLPYLGLTNPPTQGSLFSEGAPVGMKGSRGKGQLKVKSSGLGTWHPIRETTWWLLHRKYLELSRRPQRWTMRPEKGGHTARVQNWAQPPPESVRPCIALENDEAGPSSLGFLPLDPLLAGDQGQEGD